MRLFFQIVFFAVVGLLTWLFVLPFKWAFDHDLWLGLALTPIAFLIIWLANKWMDRNGWR